VFRTPDGFVIALTYGAEKTEWVKNVVAAGGERRVAGAGHVAVLPRGEYVTQRTAIGPISLDYVDDDPRNKN
jgi:hypothetical protein